MRFAHGTVLMHRIGSAIHDGGNSYPVVFVRRIDPSDKNCSALIRSNDRLGWFLVVVIFIHIDARPSYGGLPRKFALGERSDRQIIVDNHIQFIFLIYSRSCTPNCVPPGFDIVFIVYAIIVFLIMRRNSSFVDVLVPVILNVCQTNEM